MRLLSIIFIFNLFIVGICTSCRSTQEYRTTVDSLTVSKMGTATDSVAEAKLKRFIEQMRENYVFILRDTRTVRDSSGLEHSHTVEHILQHTKETKKDSTSAELIDSIHHAKIDSTAVLKSELVEDKSKEMPTRPLWVKVVITLLTIAIIRLVYVSSK